MRKQWLVCAGILAMSASLAYGVTPSFQGLGELPGGGYYSEPWGISGDGSTVVGQSESAQGYETFLWTADGGMIALGDLSGGGFNSAGYAVSADGSVVVGHGTSDSGSEAYRWTAQNGMFGLGDLPGGDFESGAYAVSADGSVVAGFGNSDNSSREAFRWTQTTGMVGLGDLPGGDFWSRAYGVSADGSVVVGYSKSANCVGSWDTEAFMWTAGTGMVGLGDFPGGGFQSVAYAVSANGSVVVGEARSDSGNEAFRWTPGTGLQKLGDLPGGIYGSWAKATSADGSMVVGASNTDFPSYQAFIWDEHNGMRNLKEVLETDFGLDLSDWLLLTADGISADGRVIVGSGGGPNGAEGWIAVIPEPATLGLLAAGVGAIWMGKRRVTR